MRSIAVLLTVYNRKIKTLQCLSNLYNQIDVDNIVIDVYLTNDGCTDGTPEAIRQNFPNVNIIDSEGNLFWNRGMFKAWEEAAIHEYDFYLWLNDDTFVYSNMLSSLIQAALSTENKAIIVGPTCSTTSKTVTYGGRMEDGSIPIPNGSLISVSHFNGNIVLVPKLVYDKLGNLDYYFTHSKGDFDYGLRARKFGFAIYQYGDFLGECDLHPTIDKWCNPSIPFRTRLKLMRQPNGMPPNETFHLERRHYGIVIACFHFLTIYLRVCFPKLWIK